MYGDLVHSSYVRTGSLVASQGGVRAVAPTCIGQTSRGQEMGVSDNQRAHQRASEVLPEEASAGIEDAEAMAKAVLADSDDRQFDREASPGTTLEHRRSEPPH